MRASSRASTASNIPQSASAQAATLLSAKSLAWMAVSDHSALSADEAAILARVAQDAEVSTMVALARRFVDLVRGCCITATAPCPAPVRTLRCWIRDTGASGLRAIATFAIGLQKDDAVQAALSTRWSNAQAEGHITRLKRLKRQMCGRASLDLLRRRLLLAP